MIPTFTILVGSIGRPVLKNALDSIKRQERISGDQVIISFDSFEADPVVLQEKIDFVHSYGEGFIACEYNSGYHWLGVEQINHALRTIPITGSRVITIGDDDVFVDGAYRDLRPFCELYPGHPLVYRFLTPAAIGRQLLWDKPRVRSCFISGCCMAAPYEFVEPMHTRIETTHDYDWMIDILSRSKEPIYLDYTGVIARPDQRGDDVTHQGIGHCWHCRNWWFREDAPITKTHCEQCGALIDLGVYRPRIVSEYREEVA